MVKHNDISKSTSNSDIMEIKAKGVKNIIANLEKSGEEYEIILDI